MKNFLGILAISLSSMLVAQAAEPAHVDGKAATVLVQMKKATVLDVRSAEEYAEGHIDQAVNIDFLDDSFESKVAKLDKAKPYLVHCAGGGRSTNSLEVFKKLGFTNITHLDGGLKAYTKAGGAVTK